MGYTVDDLKSIILEAEEFIAVPNSDPAVRQASQVILLAQELIEMKKRKELSDKLYRSQNTRSSSDGAAEL